MYGQDLCVPHALAYVLISFSRSFLRWDFWSVCHLGARLGAPVLGCGALPPIWQGLAPGQGWDTGLGSVGGVEHVFPGQDLTCSFPHTCPWNVSSQQSPAVSHNLRIGAFGPHRRETSVMVSLVFAPFCRYQLWAELALRVSWRILFAFRDALSSCMSAAQSQVSILSCLNSPPILTCGDVASGHAYSLSVSGSVSSLSEFGQNFAWWWQLPCLSLQLPHQTTPSCCQSTQRDLTTSSCR